MGKILSSMEDFQALVRASRAQTQALYNNIWRMGDNADRALTLETVHEIKELAHGIGDISHAARYSLDAFSREQLRFIPYYDPAWKPGPLTPELERSRPRKCLRL